MKAFSFISTIFFIVFTSFSQKELDVTSEFNLEKMSRKVNSSYHEGSPVISPDGNIIYFFRTNHPRNRYGSKGTQDAWYSVKGKNGKWGEAIHMDNNINRFHSNQVLAVLDQGKALLITGGGSKKSKGISIVYKSGESWGKAKVLDIPEFSKMNQGKYYGACMTDDHSVIVFYFSETKDSQTSDLYFSKKTGEFSYTKPEKMSLSTGKDEFSPFIATDNQTLYFASDREGTTGGMDIWKVKRQDGSWQKWSKPENIGPPVNTGGFDAYFSVDESWNNAYTTRSYVSRDGGSLDILHLTRRPTVFLRGKMLDKLTKEPVEGDFKLDILKKGAKTFSTDEKGKYLSKLKDNGLYVFTASIEGYEDYRDTLDLSNIPLDFKKTKDLILTPFAKDVHITGNVYDKNTNKPLAAGLKFSSPVHETLRVNSFEDDGYYQLVLHDVGKYKLQVKRKGYRLYSEIFTIPPSTESHVEVKKDVYLEREKGELALAGTVYDEETFTGIASVLRYVAPSGKKGIIKTDKSGVFRKLVVEKGVYKLYTSSKGYLNADDTTDVQESNYDTDREKEIFLNKIEVGAKVVLKEIYFDTDKATLRPESFKELDRVVEFMNKYKNLKVEISGHTDSDGSDEYNRTLSQNRAESVVQYLIEKGIDSKSFKAKGYGESKPSVPNTSTVNKQINRRVEFTVLEIN